MLLFVDTSKKKISVQEKLELDETYNLVSFARLSGFHWIAIRKNDQGYYIYNDNHITPLNSNLK